MITSWDDLPLFIHARHVADLLGRTEGGVKKSMTDGTLPGPTPISKKPWTWYRDDWRNHFEKRRTPLRRIA